MYDLEYEPPASTALQGRWDVYGPVHKGMRYGHASMMARLGAADWAADPAPLLVGLREHLRLAARHLSHEEEYLHPALQGRDPGAVQGLAVAHDHHRARFEVLEGQITGLEVAAAADRPALGRDLYLGFTAFVAEDLAHMREEETVTWPRLCAAFSDAELQALEGAIVASQPPEDVVGFMRLMAPALSGPDRAGLFAAMKAGAPPAAYQAVMEAVRPVLTPEDWADLQRRGLTG